MKASTIHLDNISRGATFNRKVSYMIPYDLGVTFGSIYNTFSKWVKRDLKGAVTFKTDYIKTQVTSDQKFLWNKGLLAQAAKPVLALQCTLDHTSESDVWKHPSVRNWESIHFLEPDEFTYPLISLEDNLDMKNNIEFRIAMKSLRVELFAGAAVATRWEADNIANYWTTRRSTNYYYNFPMVIDFKIPDEIIYAICEQFNMDMDNHHILLKWLNRHSHGHIYYTMDGYNGKYYYFFRYNAEPLIKVLDIRNPVEFDVNGLIKGESYTVSRTFEMEVLIPSIISASKYGDRLNLEDLKYKISSGVYRDGLTKAHTDIHERYVEIERVFENKHAYMKVEFSWTHDDLEELPDGSVVTREFDLNQLIKEDQYIQSLLVWAKSKGYKMHDIFNFQLYKHGAYWRENPLRNSIDQDNDEIKVPDDNEEYKYYIKNMNKFTIRDIKPDLKESLVGILYLDLLVKNQFDYYLNSEVNSNYANDDLGIRLPYGPSKEDKGTDYQ